jgi:hypothetical protein
MDNEKLKALAQKILSLVPNAPETFGSVIAILMIISIIITLVRVIQECRQSKLKLFKNKNDKYSFMMTEIKSSSIQKSWFTKRTIKKLLKKELTTEEYEKYGVSLMNAILECGSNLSTAETITLMEAAHV